MSQDNRCRLILLNHFTTICDTLAHRFDTPEWAMPFLDAALAFAVTMLAIATIVSKIVDFIYGVLFLRNRLFEQMLTEVAKRVEQEAIQESTQVRAVVTAMIARENRTWIQWFWQYISGQLPTSVSVDEFVKSVLGNAAQEEQVKKLEALLKSEGDKLTEYLRSRSRWVALLVAVAMALFFNIDSIYIADKYVQTPALSREIASREGKALAEAEEELKTAKDKLTAAQSPGSSEVESDLETLKGSVVEVQQKLNGLKASSFPIGQHYFPYFPYYPYIWCPTWELRARWVLGIILTCLCAGLGTPFWYDLITGLTSFAKPENNSNSRTSP